MNSGKNTMKKGFTLVELIVVMAIMSILLLAVMSMTEPATRIMKRTSMSETAYSMANNAENVINRTLDYADAVWIADSDSVDASGANLIDAGAEDPCESMAKKFFNTYYKNVAVPTEAGSNGKLKFVQGNIYVMKLSNSTGEITVSKYHYKNSSIDTLEKAVTTKALPDAYFKGEGAKYNIRYALCSSQLGIVDDGGADKRNADNDPYYNLLAERDGEVVNPDVPLKPEQSSKDQNITIIVNKGGKPSAPAADQPTEFEGPAVSSVAPLPFTNINSRGTRPERFITDADDSDNFAVQGTLKSKNDLGFDGDSHYPDAFVSFPGQIGLNPKDPDKKEKVSTQRDIYFVYAYADELIKHE